MYFISDGKDNSDSSSEKAEIESLAAEQVSQHLQEYQERAAAGVREDWWLFFFKMAGMYR